MNQMLPRKMNKSSLGQSTTMLNIKDIRINGGTQSRAEINEQTVSDYAEEMLAGAKFPAIIIYHDGQNHWLADGFHRVHAASKADIEQVEAEIRQGDKRAAVLHSVGANAIHGLRRTRADKRRAVMCLLEDDEWNKWSNREIARRCGVHSSFVDRLRKDSVLPLSGSTESSQRTFVHHLTGAPATMNTANIGSSKELKPSISEPNLPIEVSEFSQTLPPELNPFLQEENDDSEEELWTDREIDKQDAMRRGEVVVINMRTEHQLMRWAVREDLFVRADRKSIWGNPFHMGMDGDRCEVCDKYEQHYFPHKPSLTSQLTSLKGKALGCWCDPERCHAHTIRDEAMKVISSTDS